MEINREMFRLYAVTDRTWLGNQTLEAAVEAAIDGGAGLVQLREKALPNLEFLEEAKRLAALCRRKGVPLIINDSVEIARLADADGVHVGQGDVTAARARAELGPNKLIGVSAHSVEEALAAQSAGADYLGIGAAFATGTKADAAPVSRATIRAVTSAVTIPVVAIGGVDEENLLQLRGCGLDGVAVISALFSRPDIKAAARRLRSLAEQIAR